MIITPITTTANCSECKQNERGISALNMLLRITVPLIKARKQFYILSAPRNLSFNLHNNFVRQPSYLLLSHEKPEVTGDSQSPIICRIEGVCLFAYLWLYIQWIDHFTLNHIRPHCPNARNKKYCIWTMQKRQTFHLYNGKWKYVAVLHKQNREVLQFSKLELTNSVI